MRDGSRDGWMKKEIGISYPDSRWMEGCMD
jgi:hypothetical protein